MTQTVQLMADLFAFCAQLREVWPDDHWDHWMRHSGVSRGRECVVPEVSRTYNIGELGSSTRLGFTITTDSMPQIDASPCQTWEGISTPDTSSG